MYTVHCRVLLLVAWLTSGVLSTQTPVVGRYMYTIHCTVLLLLAWLTSGILSTPTPFIGRYQLAHIYCTLYSSTCWLVNQGSPLHSNSFGRSVHVHYTLYSSSFSSLFNQWSPLHSNSFCKSVMYTIYCTVLLLVACLTSGVLSILTPIIDALYSSTCCLVNQSIQTQTPIIGRYMYTVHCTVLLVFCCGVLLTQTPLVSRFYPEIREIYYSASYSGIWCVQCTIVHAL